jgi:Nuclear transport factor 2 (NTF2) domain/TAP C-terminal domain
MLDLQEIGQDLKISFDVPSVPDTTPSKLELPAPIAPGAWGEGSSDVGVSFLTEFFRLFDSDRQTLIRQYYTPTTLFSLSVDSVTPHLPTHQRRGAFSGPNQPSQATNLSGYIPQSRNLLRTTNLNARLTRLHPGRDHILQAFQNLPRTRHPTFDPAAFVADGFLVQIGNAGGIMVSVHGEFFEVNERGGELRRSFDRTFLLGPPASSNPGSHCVVVSDLLVLRLYSGREAWTIEDNGAGSGAETLVSEVRKRTGLNEQYARLLLQECGGDIEAGVRRFEEAKVLHFQIGANFFRLRIKFQWRHFDNKQCKRCSTGYDFVGGFDQTSLA